MNYSLQHISDAIDATFMGTDHAFDRLLTDSRKLQSPATTLFFAIRGEQRDGHIYIEELYEAGVRAFVVQQKPATGKFEEAGFLLVEDAVEALQKIATIHRQAFSIPVIGITGSNGKTIVKEWLNQLLQDDYNIVRSPRSYNSQIGVPLSVWQMDVNDTLGIFEAGISEKGEMQALQQIIQPTIGILTNIGSAHSEGFDSDEQKLREKLLLFKGCKQLIYPADNLAAKRLKGIVEEIFSGTDTQLVSWGKSGNWLQLLSVQSPGDGYTHIEAKHSDKHHQLKVRFSDEASIENILSCWTLLLLLGYDDETINQRMQSLHAVAMRQEWKTGINRCVIINDSYSADITSLQIALPSVAQSYFRGTGTVILSDFLQQNQQNDLYPTIASLLKQYKIRRLIGIGEEITAANAVFHEIYPELLIENYPSTQSFLDHFLSSNFKEETILVKGARVFEFEKIVNVLEQKVHQTVLEINLNAIVHNIKTYRSHLNPGVKVMAMVKAFAYGSGGAEIASILQYHGIVDYLGVAYADEGVELRKAGVRLPIMVMNPELSTFDAIVEHNLEPDLYSKEMLLAFAAFLEKEGIQQYPVHLEIETGMNRLGILQTDIDELATVLHRSTLKVQSIFSHLAASEDPNEDVFTQSQVDKLSSAIQQIQSIIDYPFIQHIANTGAIVRKPEWQMDMVRLGIGMYGVDSSKTIQAQLIPVGLLKTTIAQLRKLDVGDTVGYNRRGKMEGPSTIATIRIGYADGFSRKLGHGVGKVWIGETLCPVIGTVCMDMTMIDVSAVPGVKEGDEVVIFGGKLFIGDFAAWAGTIPYEVLTGISQRVKRVYFEE